MENKRKCLVLAIIILMVFIVNSCDGNEEQIKPTCAEACPETQRDHLGINEICTHNGKIIQGTCNCTEQKTTIPNTTIQIKKEAGITVAQMNAAVEKINDAYIDFLSFGSMTEGKVTVVRIVSGEVLDMNGTTMTVGIDADQSAMAGLFYVMSMAKIQPQTKSTWLVDKGNRGKTVYDTSV